MAACALLFAAAAAAVVRMAFARPSWDRQADLHVYFEAVRWVRDGEPLYTYTAQNGDPFTYPPFALLVFWPLGWMSEAAARVVWTAATLAAVLVLAAALTARQGVAGRRRFACLTLAGAAVLVWSAPLQSNIRLGQVSVFVALLAFMDALELTPKWARGALVGIAAAVKLTPLIFVPYLWVTGQRKAAVRAGAVFAACTGGVWAVWPSASVDFWTEAIFATSRIGNLAATGNQSVNGALIRTSLPTAERSAAWLVLSAAVCAVAFLAARELQRRGEVARAGVVVGCASVAASPVSWTHHQVWTVLAGLLLVAGTGRWRIAGGAALLAVMTFTAGGWVSWALPDPLGGFVHDNLRGMAAVAVCAGATAGLWRVRVPMQVRVAPGFRLVALPRAWMAMALVAAVGAAGLLALSRDETVQTRVLTAETASEPWFSADSGPCGFMGYDAPGVPVDEMVFPPRPPEPTHALCRSPVGERNGGIQLNFTWAAAPPPSHPAGHPYEIIDGFVGTDVARVVYVPVEGTEAIEVPLLPAEIGPAPEFATLPGDGRLLPVLDERTPGVRRFTIATTNSRYAHMLAFDAAGRLIEDGSDKLRDG
ncbi:glycosyltransferase 87 family protein [Yinghuangia soli]|uniref:Glycosyltransferase 87 family protein n=1 Tax=Yinghuangia soli TaxID=2908204 RepID=A0AA41Q6Q2_9ACTN|nr:glycosyltransferase 87 family protein [Yinghuangia soli]MCF2532222.1 glycosyltransferase 87 family protein [Yinghuangia soli]